MKKTFTINISGTIFHIEEDAYEKLQGYFLRLKNHFGNSSEGREIINDIESRIAELFMEKTAGESKVITLDMIEEVMATMGSPEDFVDPDANEEPIPGITRRKKRLYRSPDSRVIAGVCGGLGAYFKIDPVILRIVFVLMFFVNGVGLLAYIILWIAVPRAVTTSQKLEMKGEEVTVSNIERSFRDQAQETGEVMAGDNKPADTTSGHSETKIYSKEPAARRKPADTSSNAGKALLRGIAVLFGAFFIVTGFFGLIALISSAIVGQSLVGSWPLSFSSDFQINHVLEHFVSPGSLTLGIISLAILVGIPFLAMFFVGTKLIFNFKTNNAAIGLGMIGVWLVALVTLLVVSAGEAGNYKSQTSLTNSETVLCDSCSTFYLRLSEDRYAAYPESEWNLDRFKVVTVDGKNLMLGQPRFDIEKSGTDDVVLVFRKRARGRDQADANENIQEIVYNYQVSDSIITFDPWFLNGTDGKWRDQRVDIILRLPVGKSVYLSDEMVKIIHDIENVSNTWDREMAGKYWDMLPDGLTLREKEESPE
jgi:phage shock protein PspC (stress-responsive transcriptional regulator)